MPQRPCLNRGSALISALFITALAAIIAVSLAVRGRLIIHEGELVKNADQTYLNLQSLQFWAKNQIYNFLSQWTQAQGQSPATLHPMEWSFGGVRVGDQKVTADIIDAQGRFNINDLQYLANQPRFVSLLMAVEPTVTQKQATQIAQSITDWMTKGALDPVYLKANPPYRASKNILFDVSELRMIYGITADIYQHLLPYIIALPENKAPAAQQVQSTDPSQPLPPSAQTMVNINSAQWPVLLTVNPQLKPEQAQNLEACRKQFGYFTSIDQFNSVCKQQTGLPSLNGNLTTHSDFYLLKSVAQNDEVMIHFDSLLVSSLTKTNKLEVKVVWQSFY